MRSRAAPARRGAGARTEEDSGGGFFPRQADIDGRSAGHLSENIKTKPRPRAGDQGLASRLAAADILFRVDRESAYADVLLGARLPEFAPADRRLITRLVLGTIAWK